jgi:ribonuclease HI
MISIFSDGSSAARGNCPIGWGWVIVRLPYDVLLAGSGCHPSSTNNGAELRGAIYGLKAFIDTGLHITGELAELVCDSMYVLDLASGKSTPTANLELAQECAKLAQEAKIHRFRWVPGHSGDVFNERCDTLAKDAKNSLLPPKTIRRKEKKALKAKAKKLQEPVVHEGPQAQVVHEGPQAQEE